MPTPVHDPEVYGPPAFADLAFDAEVYGELFDEAGAGVDQELTPAGVACN